MVLFLLKPAQHLGGTRASLRTTGSTSLSTYRPLICRYATSGSTSPMDPPCLGSRSRQATALRLFRIRAGPGRPPSIRVPGGLTCPGSGRVPRSGMETYSRSSGRVRTLPRRPETPSLSALLAALRVRSSPSLRSDWPSIASPDFREVKRCNKASQTRASSAPRRPKPPPAAFELSPATDGPGCAPASAASGSFALRRFKLAQRKDEYQHEYERNQPNHYD